MKRFVRAWNQLVVCDGCALDFASRDPFEIIEQQQSEIVRDAVGRRTVRFSTNGQSYFAKLHTGVGWREILKNVLRLRWPVIGAADEWRAIHHVMRMGIRTTKPIAFGSRGRNPARLKSFLITEDLGETVSIQTLARRWSESGVHLDLKRKIINDVGYIVRTLHRNGMNHRDLYLCHFRVDESAVSGSSTADFSGLYLMDLHRAQTRSRVPYRWLVKDLGGLLFSATDSQISQRDVLRFVRAYSGGNLRETLERDRRLWRGVLKRAQRMYTTHRNGSAPPRLRSLAEAAL